MKTYTAIQTDRHGNALDGAESRKYHVITPALAARFHVIAIASKDYVHGGSKNGVYTFNPTAKGSVIFVRIIEGEPQMTVEQAREVIRGMKRGNFDSALADQACAVLSDFDPVFSETTSETSGDPVTQGDSMNTAIVTIGDLAIGDTGKIVGGKFAGREFRVRALGTQGRTVMVRWHGSADTGSIRATTQVEIEVGDGMTVGAVVEFREGTPQFAKNQGIRYVVVSSPLGDNTSESDGKSYVWLVHQDDITKAPSRRRIRSGYVSALRIVGPDSEAVQ